MSTDPVRITRLLWRVAVVLVALDVLASAGAAAGVPYSLTHFFDGDDKTNVPTAFKTTMLLALTLLLLSHWSLARWNGDPFERSWFLLALVAAFAFTDESTYLHQTLGHIVHDHLHTHGLLGFAWVIVYVPALAAVAFVTLARIRHLPAPLRRSLFVGAVLYGFGAVALEPVKSEFSEHRGELSLSFKLVAAVSDSLEMVGLTVLVAAMIVALARRTDGVLIQFRRS